MPTYEYTCKRCGQTIEAFQSFSEKPLRTHDGCGGDLQKVFHARGVVFKGSGFYSTDSRTSKGAPTSNGSEKKDKKTGSGKKPTSEISSSAAPSKAGGSDSGAD